MTKKPKVKKPRPARREYGRPQEQPGPQPTFSGAFQVTLESPPSTNQTHFRLGTPPSHSDTPPSAPAPATNERPRDHQRDGAGPSSSSRRRSSVTAPAAAAATLNDRLRAEVVTDAAAAPSKKHRPSSAGHRATQSSPVVPTTLAAGARFTRNRSSTTVAADMLSPVDFGVPGPSSLPVDSRGVSLPPVSGYHAARPLVPSTPGLYPSSGTTSSVHTPSSGSGASTSRHRRLSSYEPPEVSPISHSPWSNASPSPAPHTPGSLRGASVPPSVLSESSPYLGLVIGDFSPEMQPVDADGEELPPLTPDRAAPELPRLRGSRPRSHSAAHVPRDHHGLFMSATASQSSVSVPEELRDLAWPEGLFGSEESVYAGPNTLNEVLPALPALPPPPGPSSSFHTAPRRSTRN